MYACTLDSDSDTTLDEDDSPRSQDDYKDEATANHKKKWSWVEGDNQPQPQPETVIERPETLIEDNDYSSESDGIIEIAPSGYSEGAAAAATPESECMLLGVIASVDQLLVSLVLFYLLNIS